MSTEQKLVKITGTGKVSIRLSESVKPFMLALLQMFIENLRAERKASGNLTAMKVDAHINLAIVEEIFMKYHLQLHLLNQGCKITLTLAQALVFWSLCQSYDDDAYTNPEMGNLLMQLHIKLTRP